MRTYKWTLMPCVLLFSACPKDSPVLTTSDTDATDGPLTGEVTEGPTTGPVTGEATEGPTTGPATEGPVTGEATEGPVTGEATEGPVTGGTDTEEPVECEVPDPGVTVELALAFDGWGAVDIVNHDVDTTCVVGEITMDGEFVTTALSCELDGVTQAGSLRVSAAALDQDYAAGEQVKLQSWFLDDTELFTGVYWRFSMRAAADDRLLVAGARDETLAPGTFAPLVIEDVFACGESEMDVLPMRLDISIPEGPTVGVFSGRSEVLDAGDGDVYAIDVEEATNGNCCHYSLMHRLLVRRVAG